MGIVVYSLLWVLQDLYHQPCGVLPNQAPVVSTSVQGPYDEDPIEECPLDLLPPCKSRVVRVVARCPISMHTLLRARFGGATEHLYNFQEMVFVVY